MQQNIIDISLESTCLADAKWIIGIGIERDSKC